MNDDQRRDQPVSAAGEGLRARTLRHLLPALVHRLNNALAVVQCVQELGSEASVSEREHASAALLTLRDSLERLAVLARASPARPAPAAPALFRTHALLLGALASSLRVELELREGALPQALDAHLEGLFLDLSVALLAGAAPAANAARRVRLVARTLPGEVRLTLAALGLTPGAEAAEALALVAGHARARGWRLAQRSTRWTFAVRLGLPAQDVLAADAPAARGSARRVLLLHGAGPERQELAAFLREQGLVVAESAEVPESGAFELALVERRLALADAALPARLRERCGAQRIELLAPRTSPAMLLQLVY